MAWACAGIAACNAVPACAAEPFHGRWAPDAFSGQDYFPDALGRKTFYDPPERGFEREIRKRLEYWAKLRRERSRP